MTNRLEVATSETPMPSQVFASHFAYLVRLGALLGADDPEDIAQEALARLHKRRHTLRDHNADRAYARAVVVNLTRSRIRHLRVAARHVQHAVPVESPESLVLLRADQRELVRAVARLPRRQREVIVLRYWEELTEAEIAATLGVAKGTVKSTASKAIAALNAAVQERS